MSDEAKRVPLSDVHVRLGARMVGFGGYWMPLQYSSIREEHLAVRGQAGLFDVSHMGEVSVRGAGALDFLQNLVTNDVSKLTPGRALYTVMCREDGGIVDDLLVYRDPDDYMLVINAARHDADLEWMRGALPGRGVQLDDISAETALLAVQGPKAAEIVARLCPGQDPLALRYYHHQSGEVAEVPARISRTGYTGEDGFELYVAAGSAARVWGRLLEEGAADGLRPAGLAARDTLRLEAGFRLYGQDMDEQTDPFSAGLGWVVKLGKGDFRGREMLAGRAAAPPRATVGLRLGAREVPRHAQAVFSGERQVGTVTSGSFGFTVGAGLALASVEPGCAAEGTQLRVRLRSEPDQWATAPVVALPFYRRPAGAA